MHVLYVGGRVNSDDEPDPNSTTSFCCGSVGQRVVGQEQAVQHLDMLGCCSLFVVGLGRFDSLWSMESCGLQLVWIFFDLEFVVDLSYSKLYNKSVSNRSKWSLGGCIWEARSMPASLVGFTAAVDAADI